MSQQISPACGVVYICHHRFNGWIFNTTTQGIGYSPQLINRVKQAVGLAVEFAEMHNKRELNNSARYRMTDNRVSPGQGEVRPLNVLFFPLWMCGYPVVERWSECPVQLLKWLKTKVLNDIYKLPVTVRFCHI